MRDQIDVRQLNTAYVIGGAAGLATHDMAEGIGPAVRSSIHAANAIADGTDCQIDTMLAYSPPPGWGRRVDAFQLSASPYC